MAATGTEGTPSGRVLEAVALGLAAAAVAAHLLAMYAIRGLSFPVGYDTPRYIWRANLAAATGLSSLRSDSVLASRPGNPALEAVVHAVTGLRPFDASFVLPAVVGAMIAAAAGALALAVLREPRWAAPVYALVVGGSVNVALVAVNHQDNLVLDALVMAAVVLILLAPDRPGAVPGAVLLLVGAVLFEWYFAAVVMGLVVVLVVAGAWFPRWLGERPDGAGFWGSPPGVLLALAGATAAVGAAALVVLGSGPPQGPPVSPVLFRRGLRSTAPRFDLWVAGPLAALGAWFLGRREEPGRRRALVFIVCWALVPAAAAAALVVLDVAVPAHRLLAFSFAIPLLVAAALVGVAGVALRTGRWWGRIIAAAVLVAGVAGGGLLAHRVWFEARQLVSPRAFAQASEAGTYLERDAAGRPAVVVVDTPGSRPGSFVASSSRVIDTALPPLEIERVHLYLGDVALLLANQPTLRAGQPLFERTSLTLWDNVRPSLGHEPVVIVVAAFNRGFDTLVGAHPEWQVTPTLAVVRGPRPAAVPSGGTTLHRLGFGRLAAWALAMLAALAVAGLGWAVALVPAEWAVRLALAPALGTAATAMGGTVADRLGVLPATGAGIGVFAGVAATGWGVVLLVRARRRRDRAAT